MEYKNSLLARSFRAFLTDWFVNNWTGVELLYPECNEPNCNCNEPKCYCFYEKMTKGFKVKYDEEWATVTPEKIADKLLDLKVKIPHFYDYLTIEGEAERSVEERKYTESADFLLAYAANELISLCALNRLMCDF